VPNPKVQIFTVAFLCIALTNLMFISLKVTFISSPIICVEASNIKGGKQGFELLEYVIPNPLPSKDRFWNSGFSGEKLKVMFCSFKIMVSCLSDSILKLING
jgi:hypothetical protein